MSTVEGVQYTRGLSLVHWEIPRCVFSTPEGYDEYTRGIS